MTNRLLLAVKAIHENLGKPKSQVNGYALFYEENYKSMKTECNR
jgi:hypothetical protein